MEFKGDEFIRNIVIESEKAELEKKVQNLEAQKNESVVKKAQSTNQTPQGQSMPINNLQNNTNNSFIDNDAVIVDIKNNFDDELGDIKLEEHDPKNDIKKKYIILSIALSILFILTIIIIRLISDDTQDDTLFNTPTTQKIEQDNILNGSDSEEKYEALISQKAKQTIQKELDLEKIAKEEIPLPKIEEKVIAKQQKEVSDDIFGMEKKSEPLAKETIAKKEVIKKEIKKVVLKVVKKTIVKPIAKEIPKPIVQKPKPTAPKQIQTTKTLKGNFIQIGAFTKQPNKTLLNKITKAGYRYVIHKMTIKGTVYNKVLIGSYTESKSKQALEKIRKDLNKPNAYILRLK